jgi:hypothetical protein
MRNTVKRAGKGGIGKLRAIQRYGMPHMQKVHVWHKKWNHNGRTWLNNYTKIVRRMLNVKGTMVKKSNCHVSGVQQSARGLAWRQLKKGLAARGAMQKQRKKRPTCGCNSAGTNSQDVQQSARGLVWGRYPRRLWAKEMLKHVMSKHMMLKHVKTTWKQKSREKHV